MLKKIEATLKEPFSRQSFAEAGCACLTLSAFSVLKFLPPDDPSDENNPNNRLPRETHGTLNVSTSPASNVCPDYLTQVSP